MKKLFLAMTVLSLFGLSVSCNRGGGNGADQGTSPSTGSDTQMEQDQGSQPSQPSQPMDQSSPSGSGSDTSAPASGTDSAQ